MLVRFGHFGFQFTCHWPGTSVLAMLITLLTASSGGVGANMLSVPFFLICLATSLAR